jgi:hypothetical protein
MCHALFIVDVLLIPLNMLSESKKIMRFCSEYIFSLSSSVPPTATATASAVIVDAILAILTFQLYYHLNLSI